MSVEGEPIYLRRRVCGDLQSQILVGLYRTIELRYVVKKLMNLRVDLSSDMIHAAKLQLSEVKAGWMHSTDTAS